MSEKLLKPGIKHPNDRTWTISKSLNGGVRIALEGVATIDLSPDGATELACAILEMAGFKLEKTGPRPGLHLNS